MPHSLNEETNYFKIVFLMSYFSPLVLKAAYLGTIYAAIGCAALYPEITLNTLYFTDEPICKINRRYFNR